MTAQEIDSFARSRNPLPKEASLPDTGLYIILTRIYDRYDTHVIPLSFVKSQKSDAFREWEQWQSYKAEYSLEAQKRNKIGLIMSEANKHGCPLCQEIAKVYDGRESIQSDKE